MPYLERRDRALACRELRMAGAGHPIEHFRRPVQIPLHGWDVSRFDFARWWDLARGGVDARGPDDDCLLSVLGKFRADELALKAMMAALRIDPIRIDYDDPIADPKRIIAGVVSRPGLDVPPDDLTSPFALRPTSSHRRRVSATDL